MKALIVLYGENCAYCKKAKMLIARAIEKDARFSAADVRFVEEKSAEGRSYKHRFVPAFYCDGKLFFQGNPMMSDVIAALSRCIGG